MKNLLLILTVILNCFATYSQYNLTKITHNQDSIHLTTNIKFDLSGTYLIDNAPEPILTLNRSGDGLLQDKDLIKHHIKWGILCNEEGIPIYNHGFDSRKYTFYYKIDETANWISSQISIHYKPKKIYIMGERVKHLTDEL